MTKKSILITVIALVIILLIAILLTNTRRGNDGKKFTTHSFSTYNSDEGLSQDIVNCEFKVNSHFVFQDSKGTSYGEDKDVYYETTNDNPLLITFSGLSSPSPKLKGNNGSSELATLKDNEESIILAEPNAFGDISVYTIFKKEKVATWYKSYKLADMPYSMLSMGYCY